MKAIVCESYGAEEVLQLKEINMPSPKHNEVLIRNYATTVTAADTMMRKGELFIGRLYLGLKKPNKQNKTIYEIGSISKTFSGTLLAQTVKSD